MIVTVLFHRLGLNTGVQPLGTGMAAPLIIETALTATLPLLISSYIININIDIMIVTVLFHRLGLG